MSSDALRKRSSLFMPSRSEIAATSQVSHGDAVDTTAPRRPHTPVENTFKLKPERIFATKAVEDVIKEVLKGQLAEEAYDPRSSKQLAKTLSTLITNRVKGLGFERYKIVTIVTVGQIADQDVRVASRCLFDQETDRFGSASFQNSSVYGVATVYGIYFE